MNDIIGYNSQNLEKNVCPYLIANAYDRQKCCKENKIGRLAMLHKIIIYKIITMGSCFMEEIQLS